ncbi:2-dehydropantoate 2-reductase [Mesobacillus foraminis]|uniref:2-dehydropantoate 2-reductase n=1 Tax=Mesobacillus foraminis TaxID=279826 RepID=UPI000EF50962|nr:2-dehydropantoate 2-reductase [Mesobacillus foraminis]
MKIGIVGGGSIGLLFSFYLSSLHKVTLYTRTPSQAERINETGVNLVRGDLSECRKIQAVSFSAWRGTDDIVIIAVKQYQLPSILAVLKKQPLDSMCLLFLQNGMGHLKLLQDIKARAIFVGTVEHGAVRDAPNKVSHNGAGVTKCAVFKGEGKLLAELSSEAPPEFSLKVERDYYSLLVQKLVVNAVINPLTAAFRVTNGTLLENPFYYQILCRVFDETAEVLELERKEEYFSNVISICHNTQKNRSSMLKDIEAGQPTEIEAILGYVLEVAEKKQKAAPLIRNYYTLIKGEEIQGEGLRSG